eukprot:Rhum_TRINITY_DN16848_c0_g1::Rhum_TRINITY_DN16848_c0_g1_i1::g.164628::m.164628
MLSLREFERLSFDDARGRVQSQSITTHAIDPQSIGTLQNGVPAGFWAALARPSAQHRDSYEQLLRLDERNVKIGVTPAQYKKGVRHRRATASDAGADPITQEDFVVGEEVAEIVKCRHVFKPTGLKKWFEKEHDCPVCRLDVRG